MAKAPFDFKQFDLKSLDLPAAAKKPLYAGVGATDLAVERVREYVADVQKKLAEVQKDVQSRVESYQKDVQNRFADVQKNVKGFEFEPKALREDARARAEKVRTQVKTQVNENVATVTSSYGDLAKRGEQLVARIRRQEATKATAASARTTASKAKTTSTQAKKTAKKTSSSAKATRTSAKKTASNAAKATSAAASKTGH